MSDHPTRRTVLQGAGAAVAAATGLAACGSGTSGASTGGGAAAAGATTVKAADVPVGGGKIVDKVVVTQPSAGTYKAFSAVCTHQACIVSAVASGRIDCACHGSAFDAATGAVLSGPATQALPAKTVTVSGDTLTVS